MVATSKNRVPVKPGTTASDNRRGRIRVHIGQSLWKFAHDYPKLQDMLLENVQNAIDAGADRMYIGVDLKDRTVVICDNGEGVTEEEYHQALQSVARGKTDKNKIGQFGIGMISPLNKCGLMYFMSRPEGQRHVNSWRFVCEAIRESEDPNAPCEELDNFPPLPAPFALAVDELQEATGDVQSTKWRTVIRLEDLIEDSVITRLQISRLETAIINRFNQWIIERGMQILVKVRDGSGKIEQRKVTPKPFLGQKLETQVIETQHAGNVTFELYRSRTVNGARKGVGVKFTDPKRYPILAEEVEGQLLDNEEMLGYYTLAKEGLEALRSGLFEGLVHIENIQAKRDRRGFELGDAFKSLCLAINSWYNQTGISYMSSHREERVEKDFSELSQDVMEQLLRSFNDNERLLDLAAELEERLPKVRAQQAAKEKQAQEEGKERTARRSSPTKRVVKPRESKKPTDQTGQPVLPRFAYDMLEDSLNLWEYDIESGVLTINLLHEHYARVYETKGEHTPRNKKYVRHLLSYLALQVMMLLVRYKNVDLEIHRSTIDDHIGPYIETIILPN